MAPEVLSSDTVSKVSPYIHIQGLGYIWLGFTIRVLNEGGTHLEVPRATCACVKCLKSSYPLKSSPELVLAH